jgi:hypothetical protein
MSTRPIDSVFGVPDPSGDAQRSGSNGTQSGLLMSDTTIHPQSYDTEAVAHAPASEVEWTSAELSSIASTIEDLQQRLEQANSRLSSAATVETTELEIGRLFVEAQRFSEDALSNLQLQINEILSAAEDKAQQILTEATAEALEIRRQAQEATIVSTRTARELQTAIAGFTAVNNELTKELGALNSMLAPGIDRELGEIVPSSNGAESA